MTCLRVDCGLVPAWGFINAVKASARGWEEEMFHLQELHWILDLYDSNPQLDGNGTCMDHHTSSSAAAENIDQVLLDVVHRVHGGQKHLTVRL